MNNRERLGSRLGFILLSAGCAIGCGNVWKFPWMAGQYGGGGFVLIYVLCLVLLGLPVMTMEFSLGRAAQASPVKMYQKLQKPGQKWHIHGYLALFGNICLMSFYTVVAGWILHALLDGFGLLQGKAAILLAAEPTTSWAGWFVEFIESLAEIYVVVCAVMLLHKGLNYFHISEWIGRMLGPVLRLLGISPKAVNIVIIGFTLGILYGSGLLIKETQEGSLSKRDSLCSISLLGLSHSLIEDTLLLMLVGGSLWGLLAFRVIFTIVVGAAINYWYPALEPLAFPRKKEAA